MSEGAGANEHHPPVKPTPAVQTSQGRRRRNREHHAARRRSDGSEILPAFCRTQKGCIGITPNYKEHHCPLIPAGHAFKAGLRETATELPTNFLEHLQQPRRRRPSGRRRMHQTLAVAPTPGTPPPPPAPSSSRHVRCCTQVPPPRRSPARRGQPRRRPIGRSPRRSPVARGGCGQAAEEGEGARYSARATTSAAATIKQSSYPADPSGAHMVFDEMLDR
jgi:hypothetical protein